MHGTATNKFGGSGLLSGTLVCAVGLKLNASKHYKHMLLDWGNNKQHGAGGVRLGAT